MAINTELNSGSNVALVNKVDTELFTLRQPLKNQIVYSGKNLKFLPLAEWNVRNLIDRAGSKRPECQTGLVDKEISRYDIAVPGDTRLPVHDMAENGYTFFRSGREVTERCEAGVGLAIKHSIVQCLLL